MFYWLLVGFQPNNAGSTPSPKRVNITKGMKGTPFGFWYKKICAGFSYACVTPFPTKCKVTKVNKVTKVTKITNVTSLISFDAGYAKSDTMSHNAAFHKCWKCDMHWSLSRSTIFSLCRWAWLFLWQKRRSAKTCWFSSCRCAVQVSTLTVIRFLLLLSPAPWSQSSLWS